MQIIEKDIELVFFSGSTLLEGPVWSSRFQAIFCVSIEQNLIYRIDLRDGKITSFETKGPVGSIAIKDNGKMLSAEKEGIFEYDLVNNKKTFLIQLEEDSRFRYNDGKLDPQGRFLVGTMGYKQLLPGKGKLFAFDGEKAKVILEGLTISNGIGFNKEGNKMYFIDTPTKRVGLYDYNSETGTATFEKYIIEIPGEGYPDGMCVDLDGMIWVAEWKGGKVCKWDPEKGEKLVEIGMPCKRVTSCCLGGENLDSLFITTAKDPEQDEPLAGGLFKVRIR